MQGLISKIVAVLLILVVFLPVHAQNDTRVTYIHTDADGTPFAATDEQGNLEWQIEHLPFGAEHRNTEVRRNSNLSFAGKLYDEEIGLSYFGGRWYDPHAGRFTGIDPMPVTAEDWRTFNRYAYGNNNPYKYVDPDGNLPILIPLVIFLAKEGAAEVASRYTGGATDFLSVRRMGSKAVKKSLKLLKQNKSKNVTNDAINDDIASKADTLKPGRFAKKSIPARGETRNFNKAERDKINAAGQADGCHTCGTKTAGTKSGNFIPDHQPANALNSSGGSQRLYPHCKGCSNRQGGQVTQAKRKQTQ